MEETPILEVVGLSKIYRSGHQHLAVLRDASFRIEAGSTCAIVGPSGSGKTTLLGLCAGLDRPSAGTVRLNHILLNDLDEEKLAAVRSRHVGFVFQTFQLIPTLTALENVMVPAELQHQAGARSHAVTLLEQVGLGDRLHHYPSQLSGGEQQRVALARAFVNRPRILFADEPTGNLDAETSAAVEELMFHLNRDAGTTLVLVTHNHELARKTERILSLRSGRLVELEPGKRVSSNVVPGRG